MSATPHLVSIIGPTATGKSDLAVFLAEQFNGEVVSADSRQVFKGLDIGSGKITPEEMHSIPHHLLDVEDVRNEFTVAHFAKAARAAIVDIQSRGKLPILCGGSGFWVDTVTRGLVIPQVPPNETLRKVLHSKTNDALYNLLLEKDPVRAATIDRHNPQRLVRALEIANALGSVPDKTYIAPPYPVLTIGITASKEIIDERIARRLDARIKEGMIDEVRKLMDAGVPSSRLYALGLEYRHVSMYLDGKYLSEKAMRDALLMDIVHFAKRQMTWFKRHKDIVWIGIKEFDKAQSAVAEWLNK
ncbi:MAG TPA: tRNA (adenosine(37)-N6)-dimethylallyltransferase MiaA [Candidatus Paceibacterota bacterium]|nr:tRNA (adenosine(37)-N6)-dimethylallyltransferase MiaA [Candidatus Paceibacterota bacterium]